MNEWKDIRVGDLGIVVTGKTPKTDITEYYGGKTPFLTPSDNMSVKYVRSTAKKLTENGKMSVKNAIIPSGAVCVSCIGSDLGKVVITTEETVTNQQINSVVVNEENYDIDFVYYSLLALGKTLNYHSKTSTAVPIINKSSFSAYTIMCPDKSVQSKIGRILSALDAKIEKNQQINDNLLQQARCLYNNCFPYTVYDTLPDGWKLATVGDIIDIHDSKRVPLSGNERLKMKNKIYPYYGAASLMDYVDDYIFDGNYLLLGEDGTVVDDKGFPILQYVWGKFWVNNHAHILTGKCGYTVESLMLLFMNTPVNSVVTGAVQAKISQANLKSIPIVLPPKGVLDLFNDQIEPFFSMLRSNIDERTNLVVLRDTLLPKLMNGELDVSSLNF